ncbi:MAG TPA: histidine kinase [Anaeromyxobacteraceae bacterium]|jgi:signal transduction histidine kinase
MAWTLWPRPRAEYEAFETAAGFPRTLWRIHVPVVTAIGALFFLEPVRRYTGARPGVVALFLGVHLAALAACVHTGLARRSYATTLLVMAPVNLAAGAAPGASTADGHSPLWFLYFAYVLIFTDAAAPSLAFAAATALVPALAAAAWHLAGLLPLERGLASVAPVALAATAGYVALAHVRHGLWESRREKADLARRLAAAEERGRIAGDLHGSLGSALTEVSLWLDVAAASPPESARQAVDRAGGRARRALDDLRTAVQALGGEAASGEALDGALRRSLRGLCQAADVGFELAVRTGDGPVAAACAYHVAKFVEEAALNAVRHAAPRRLEVRVDLDGAVAVEVRDDGRGFDPGSVAPGQGLRSLRAHAQALGGLLRIEPAPGGGTLVALRAGG